MNLLKLLREKIVYFRSKVARRIFFLFILCALIPLSVITYYSFSQVTSNLFSQAHRQLHQASKASGMATFERLLMLETDLNMMRTSFQKGKEDVLAYSVHGLHDRLKVRFKGLVLTSGNGRTKNLLGSIPAIPQLKKDDQNAVNSGMTLVLTRPATENLSGIYMVQALDPAQSSYDLLFGEISPEYLWGSEGFLSPLTQLFVLDQSNNMLFSSFPEYSPLNEMKKALREKPSTGRFTWEYGNDSYMASYWTVFMMPQFRANWILAQSQSRTDVLAPVSNFRKVFQLIVLLTFFVVVLLSLSQIRRSLVPIELLRKATQGIAAKNFNSRVTITTNDEFEELGASFNKMAASLENYLQIMITLNQIGIALSAEKDNNRLLELILFNAKKITNADGCSLFTLTGDKQLRLSVMSIDSINLVIDRADGVVVPLHDEEGQPNTGNAIAFSALKDTIVDIPDMYHESKFDFSRNQDTDRIMGYQTHSLLIVPVKNHENEIVGVIQLINAQNRGTREVLPFSEEDRRLLQTLASQAAVALSKNQLIEDFKALFDSMVELIATAIDEKSPYTGDHCRRVPELTMLLAEAACNEKEGAFKDFTLSEEQMYELRVAALLHDCGKVTTPVHIVDKATRLETIFDRIHLIDIRFELLKRDAEIAFLQKQMTALLNGNSQDFSVPKEVMDQVVEHEELAKHLEQIERDRDFVRACNSGKTDMDEDHQKRIKDIALTYKWVSTARKEEPILTDDELYSITSAQGTLTPVERELINQHVTTTMKMLEALHYPKSLRNVPRFAEAHHECMDGRGYPKGLTREQIPIQGRIIAIADIFEALTSRNRPYKEVNTLMDALSILGAMMLERHVDPDLFDVFINAQVYLRYAEKFLHPTQIDNVVLSQIPGYVSPPSEKSLPH